ncbi:MAG: type II secretion system inner membrane protein GspF [Gammaproteobacteria bacterium]
MPAFEYSALSAAGKQQRGVLEGDTARQVRQVLRDRALTPLDVKPVAADKPQEKESGVSGRGGGRRRMSAADLALLTRQLATLVRSGSPVEEALATTARQTNKAHIKRIVMAVRSRVTEGHSLEAALGDFPAAFPDLYRSTVAAGEQSGHLEEVLDRLADYTENRQEMQQRISLALFYPAILTSVAILVVVGLLTFVVPKVVTVFENIGQDLPFLTRSLIAISGALKSYGIFALIGIVIGVIVFTRRMRSEKFSARVHRVLLRTPLISRLTRGMNTARFARTLSILVASGVPVLESLRISAQVVRNLPMKQAVIDAAANVREGASIHTSLEKSHFFPPMTLHLIASGESSGNLETMLERAASHQERELNTVISALMTLFEPLLILVMGLLVLVIVLALLLPIIQLNQLVG